MARFSSRGRGLVHDPGHEVEKVVLERTGVVVEPVRKVEVLLEQGGDGPSQALVEAIAADEDLPVKDFAQSEKLGCDVDAGEIDFVAVVAQDPRCFAKHLGLERPRFDGMRLLLV
jgi:hypothetical protein